MQWAKRPLIRCANLSGSSRSVTGRLLLGNYYIFVVGLPGPGVYYTQGHFHPTTWGKIINYPPPAIYKFLYLPHKPIKTILLSLCTLVSDSRCSSIAHYLVPLPKQEFPARRAYLHHLIQIKYIVSSLASEARTRHLIKF